MSRMSKVAFVIWLTCCIGTVGILLYQLGVKKELLDKAPVLVIAPLGILCIVALGSYIFGIVGLMLGFIDDLKKSKKRNIFFVLIITLIVFSILPLYITYHVLGIHLLLRRVFRREGKVRITIKGFFLRTVAFIGNMVFISPAWVLGYVIIFTIIIYSIGYGTLTQPIAGTGSMYPTFPKSNEKDIKKRSEEIVGSADLIPYPNGLVLFGKRYFGYTLGRRDIVIARNETIEEANKKLYGSSSGVIKRIIGLPGEIIEIRDGIVYIDKKPLSEPYTYKPHSTFGGEFLQECQPLLIPKNKLFIMGDNRKGSGDSREFGLVDYADIRAVIPFRDQKGKLDTLYRNTSKDFESSTKIKLDEDEYTRLLNAKRREKGLDPVKKSSYLDKSSQLRGEIILKYNDFSFEATRSGFTMTKAMAQANYWNPAAGEWPISGYFDAEELLDYQLNSTDSKDFLFNKVYDDVGFAEVEGEINGCPSQVIVQQMAGYYAPNYKKEDVDSWRNILNRLIEIQSSWQKLKESGSFYDQNKADVDRINDIILTRISNLSSIVQKMEANKWLTTSETNYTYQDEELYREQESIASRLNSK